MTWAEFTIAVAVLLVTPGPTNTLLALAGSERGLARSLRLIPAELAGYLVTTIPLALLGGTLLSAAPGLRPVITGVAALWVAWLAVGLWRSPVAGAAPVVTTRMVFLTTLLNPKALVFGLVLLPMGPSLPAAFVTFALQIFVFAMLWALLGSSLRDRTTPSAGAPVWLRRLASLWLAIVAAGLALRAFSL